MDCPRCHMPLVAMDYEGVPVDLCEQCWGLWLDRGELAQVIDKPTLSFSPEERKLILDVRKAWDQGPEQVVGCPKCGKPMQAVQKRSPKMPDWRCSDRQCDTPLWIRRKAGAR